MKYIKFKANKLVRDKIPTILKNDGIDCECRIMDQEEFFDSLKEKIVEEAKEVLTSKNREELIEELADLIEVIEKICVEARISKPDIDNTRIKKYKEKGIFDNRIFIQNFLLPENHNKIKHYIDKGYEIVE